MRNAEDGMRNAEDGMRKTENGMHAEMKRQLALATGLVAVVASLVPLAAQSKSPIPRMKDGHPNLQGTYDLATLTPMERQAGSPLVLPDEEAKKLEHLAAARQA